MQLIEKRIPFQNCLSLKGLFATVIFYKTGSNWVQVGIYPRFM